MAGTAQGDTRAGRHLTDARLLLSSMSPPPWRRSISVDELVSLGWTIRSGGP